MHNVYIPSQIDRNQLKTISLNGKECNHSLLTSQQISQVKRFITNIHFSPTDKRLIYLSNIPYPILIADKSLYVVYLAKTNSGPLPLLKSAAGDTTYVYDSPCKLLGVGSHGIVMIGQDINNLNFYAVKEQERNPQRESILQSEKQVLVANNVLVDSAYTVHKNYQVQKLEQGIDLYKLTLLKYILPLSTKQKIEMLLSALKALQSFHQSGYIHGDIKLDNIVVNLKTNECAFIDFGLAAPITYMMINCCGTFFYWAPEVYWQSLHHNKMPHNASVEIYALGLTFAMLFSKHYCDDLQIGSESSPEGILGWYANLKKTKQRNYKYSAYLKERLQDIFDGNANEPTLNQLYAIVRSMLSIDPRERPTVSECISSVEKLLKTYQAGHDTQDSDKQLTEAERYLALFESILSVQKIDNPKELNRHKVLNGSFKENERLNASDNKELCSAFQKLMNRNQASKNSSILGISRQSVRQSKSIVK